jgi:hypothetical protein
VLSGLFQSGFQAIICMNLIYLSCVLHLPSITVPFSY